MGILISVVVCTYNRAQLLETALKSLHEQALDPALYEIVVVDNNSSDNTRAVAESFSRRMLNCRCCFEATQGLSHARNRGWEEARGEYVAYVDDDCILPKQWLVTADAIIDRYSPGVFGGPYYAFYNTPRPVWWKDGYRSHEHAEKARALTAGEYLSGGNVFFRRTLLEALGGFDPGLGMSGGKVAYGEETALLRRLRAITPDQLIYYDPSLYVYHLVPAEKMTMRWIVRQRFAAGRYAYLAFQGQDGTGGRLLRVSMRTVLTLFALTLDLGWGLLRRNRSQYPYVQNYLYEQAFNHLQTLGMLCEQHRQLVQHKGVQRRSMRAT